VDIGGLCGYITMVQLPLDLACDTPADMTKTGTVPSDQDTKLGVEVDDQPSDLGSSRTAEGETVPLDQDLRVTAGTQDVRRDTVSSRDSSALPSDLTNRGTGAENDAAPLPGSGSDEHDSTNRSQAGGEARNVSPADDRPRLGSDWVIAALDFGLPATDAKAALLV
jgi:hypothetical protein